MTVNPLLSLDREIIGDIYTTTETMDNLTVLCDDYGSRFGGSEGEKQAVAFLQEKLRAYGVQNVHTEEVNYTVWTRGAATLEIVSPIQKTIPCISLPHSPAATVEATLVDMGEGHPDHFGQRAEELNGSVAMATSEVAPYGSARRIHRSEKYGRSLVAGAKAFIFVNHYPGFGPATGRIGHRGGVGAIPGISVAYEDGMFLQRLIKRHGPVTVRIVTTDKNEPGVSWNVIGELPGKAHPEEIVMAGCHYDGHDITQGAGDPASGVVALLEAARVLATHAADLPRTLRFVFWGVEEIGLLGSRQYAEEHANAMDSIRFYLNMDAAGMLAGRQDIVLNEWPALADLFERWRSEMADTFGIAQSVSAHSDHFPFLMAGVPTGGIEKADRTPSGRGYGHTHYDTLDKISLNDLRRAAVRAARWLARIAGEEDWPVSRRSPEAVAEILDSPNYRAEEEFRAMMTKYYGVSDL
ncbi:MAG: M20/M25/M40 family metallo-hydrolase [Caldilineaceae bacterium]|nr:M20/M25/M40 family metallo-hydrolase [Caldilineaceae bacterium]